MAIILNNKITTFRDQNYYTNCHLLDELGLASCLDSLPAPVPKEIKEPLQVIGADYNYDKYWISLAHPLCMLPE